MLPRRRRAGPPADPPEPRAPPTASAAAPTTKESPHRRPQVFSWVFNYAYVGSVFLLFCHFFYMDNIAKAKAKKAVATRKAL